MNNEKEKEKEKIYNPRREMPFKRRDIPFNGGEDVDKQRESENAVRD
jgi:hypothetical protein